MNTLTITSDVYDHMHAAARRAAPLEACGLLAGQAGQVTAFYELTNADRSADHFSMVPEEQFAAVKDMRWNGTELLAIWHSHPATPARMSEEDLRLAFTPDALYVILSLAPDQPERLAAFRVEAGEPKRIEVEVTDE